MTARNPEFSQLYREKTIPVPFSGCHLWEGSIHDTGFGTAKYGGKNVRVHIKSYQTFVGEIPPGMIVYQRCGIKLCCNPDHLFLDYDKKNTNFEKIFQERTIPVPHCGCYIWEGGRCANGYGALTWNRKTVSAHVKSYETFRGPVPPDLFVCHTCDVRLCCNPNHLFVGTCKENLNDMRRKGRANDFGLKTRRSCV